MTGERTIDMISVGRNTSESLCRATVDWSSGLNKLIEVSAG